MRVILVIFSLLIFIVSVRPQDEGFYAHENYFVDPKYNKKPTHAFITA